MHLERASVRILVRVEWLDVVPPREIAILIWRDRRASRQAEEIE
jgi:hypothetical protein